MHTYMYLYVKFTIYMYVCMSFMYQLVCKMKVCIYIYLLLIEFTKFMNHEMNFTRSSFIYETREPSRELGFRFRFKFIHLIYL